MKAQLLIIKEVSLPEMIESVLNVLEPLRVQKRLEIIKNYSDKIVAIDTDKVLCRQIIIFALGHALQETLLGGSVKINISRTQNNLILSIVDGGQGIPKPELARILSLQSEDAKYQNLVLMKKMMDFLQGDMDITSNLGSGCAISLTFPWIIV